MSSNPKTSPHYSTPNAARHRRMVNLTLSEEAKARLDACKESSGLSRSAIVEALLTGDSLENIEKTSVNKKSTSKIK